jgi:hypothetical protein
MFAKIEAVILQSDDDDGPGLQRRSAASCSCGPSSAASHTAGLADRLVFSAALRRIPQEPVSASVARKPRRFRRSRDFHGRCDGHANTLTLILDTGGNVFGGFAPLQWESPPKGKWKCDNSLKSFLFHAEKSTEHLGEEICIEGRAVRDLLSVLPYRIEPGPERL